MFSGIQPTGNFHLGNYLGAVKPFLELKELDKDTQNLFCIADLHSITRKPVNLQSTKLQLAKTCIALGLHENSTLFVQSDVPEHTQLYYLLSCITYTGELSRMTQYKDKSQTSASAGLFMYPVLMAADILLYGTHRVPVGIDQSQHMELTRHLAIRFNKNYGETFIVPEAYFAGLKVYSLQYPNRKMSKSDDDPHGIIYFSDSNDEIADKIKKATTDSGSKFEAINQSLAMYNLTELYANLKNIPLSEAAILFKDSRYVTIKSEITDTLCSIIAPVRNKVNNISDEEAKVVLDKGANFARQLAIHRMKDVYEKINNKS